MYEGIFIAGFGGQGVILAGRIICLAAMGEGKHVSHIPSYGAEMRGGTANCSVVVSDADIASPLVPQPSACIVLNTPSLIKFQPIVRPGGLLIWNTSLIDMVPDRGDIEILGVAANEIAERAGSYKAANMVAVGVLLKKKPSIASVDSVAACLDSAVSARHRELNEINRRALAQGYEVA
ncbi:MAG TPA: 2-oxoacid:acceptor oxidoreductase family protein [Spirochaetia bacterium]|nr:2-oxoacid:acceptor oxidoreductase family protein [Spirochaetia bacterium]